MDIALTILIMMVIFMLLMAGIFATHVGYQNHIQMSTMAAFVHALVRGTEDILDDYDDGPIRRKVKKRINRNYRELETNGSDDLFSLTEATPKELTGITNLNRPELPPTKVGGDK